MSETEGRYELKTDEELYNTMAPPFMETVVAKAERRGFIQGLSLMAAALELSLPLRIVARYCRERMAGLGLLAAMEDCEIEMQPALRLERILTDAGFFGTGETRTEEVRALDRITKILEGIRIMRELREGGAS